MPASSSYPARYTLPIPGSFPAAFDYPSLVSSDYDWSHSSESMDLTMDLDDTQSVTSSAAGDSVSRRLEFVDIDRTALGQLGELDISFDTLPSDDGKIRVRIHTPVDASEPSSPTSSHGASSDSGSLSEAPAYPTASPEAMPDDPFLGVGASDSIFDRYAPDGSMYSHDSPPEFGFGSPSEYSVTSDHAIGKRRVRIALKSLPASGGEGGEWEVELR